MAVAQMAAVLTAARALSEAKQQAATAAAVMATPAVPAVVALLQAAALSRWMARAVVVAVVVGAAWLLALLL